MPYIVAPGLEYLRPPGWFRTVYCAPVGFLENINNHFTRSDKNKLIFIEKTGHTYQQKQQETADKLLELMKEWYPKAGCQTP